MTAILAVSLALAESALAINLTISNAVTAVGSNTPTANNIGQSFINDPIGTGSPILLNDWTFDFTNSTSATSALANTLSIYLGGGIGSGTILGSSTSTTLVTFFTSPNSVRWNFAGGVSLVDNQLYTAVIQGSTSSLSLEFSSNPYPNGNYFFNGTTSVPSVDLVFEGNFSPAATPVPFEFDASGGLAMLGAGWLLRKRFQKKQPTK